MVWAIGQLPGENGALITFFNQLRYISTEFPDLAYHMARGYFVDSQEGTRGWKSVDEAFAALCAAPREFYAILGNQRATDALYGFLASHSMEKAIAARNELGFSNDQVFKNAEVTLRLFETLCADQSAVRRFYLKFGPLGDVAWVKGHIDLYRPTTETAGRIKGHIQGMKIGGESIEEIAQSLVAMDQEVANLRGEMDANPVPRQQGARASSNGFTSDHLDCYFLHTFHGRVLPHGYAREVMRVVEPAAPLPASMPISLGTADSGQQQLRDVPRGIINKVRAFPTKPATDKPRKRKGART